MTSSARTGITIFLDWLANAISFLISSELLALAENTSTITPASRMARTMVPWKFSPGLMSREDIQHLWPRASSAEQIALAILESLLEWLIKTFLDMAHPLGQISQPV